MTYLIATTSALSPSAAHYFNSSIDDQSSSSDSDYTPSFSALSPSLLSFSSSLSISTLTSTSTSTKSKPKSKPIKSINKISKKNNKKNARLSLLSGEHPSTLSRQMIDVACVPCRLRHKSCNGGKPCDRCNMKGIADKCEYKVPAKRGRKPRSPTAVTTDSIMTTTDSIMTTSATITPTPTIIGTSTANEIPREAFYNALLLDRQRKSTSLASLSALSLPSTSSSSSSSSEFNFELMDSDSEYSTASSSPVLSSAFISTSPSSPASALSSPRSFSFSQLKSSLSSSSSSSSSSSLLSSPELLLTNNNTLSGSETDFDLTATTPSNSLDINQLLLDPIYLSVLNELIFS